MATDEGWISVRERQPAAGERVQVRHVRSTPSYDCTAEYDGGGEWLCENGFLVDHGFCVTLDFQPTHWRPLAEQVSA